METAAEMEDLFFAVVGWEGEGLSGMLMGDLGGDLYAAVELVPLDMSVEWLAD